MEVERAWPHESPLPYGRAVAPPTPRPKFGSFSYKSVEAQWRRDAETYRLVVIITLTNDNEHMLAYQLAGSVTLNGGEPYQTTTESLLHVAATKDASLILSSNPIPWFGDKEMAILNATVRYSVRYDFAETWPRDLVYHDKVRTSAKTISFEVLVPNDPAAGTSQRIIPIISDSVET